MPVLLTFALAALYPLGTVSELGTRNLGSRRPVRRALIALLACVVAGCGGSDDGAETESPIEAPPKMLTDHTAGKACTSDADCGTGSCKHELPGVIGEDARPTVDGFCSFACRLNVDCGAEGVCIGAGSNGVSFATPDERGLCLAPCDDARPCREGYRCEDLFEVPLVDGKSPSGITIGSCRPPSDKQ